MVIDEALRGGLIKDEQAIDEQGTNGTRVRRNND